MNAIPKPIVINQPWTGWDAEKSINQVDYCVKTKMFQHYEYLFSN